MPRSIPIKGKQICYTDIHLFSDANLIGVCTVAYAVVNQQNIFSQNLITSKSRLARKDLSIQRLKLVETHISTFLAVNVKTRLNKLTVRKIYKWSDSTTVLQWLKDKGKYNTFVSNRMSKIKGKGFIEWKYVLALENPANLWNRGSKIYKLGHKLWQGPKRLQDQTQQSEQRKIENFEEYDVEKKKIRNSDNHIN